MDLEDMKSRWAGINTCIDNNDACMKNKKINKMKTAQQQLIDQYRAFAGLSASFLCLSSVIFSRFFDNFWLTLGFFCFFAVAAIMDFILQRKVGHISLTTMPVMEVAERAIACRRLHHIFQLILIPSVIALLAFMAYTKTDNKAFIYGMCIGAAIGLAFGLRAYFKFMDNYKSLIKG